MFSNFGLVLWTLAFTMAARGMKSNLEQRTNLKFLVGQGKTPKVCWNELQTVFGEETMSIESVRHWHRRFRTGDGHTPVTDMLRSGRPRTQTTPEKIQEVSTVIQENGRKTISTVASEVGVSWSSARTILRKELQLKRKVAKFVLRILTDEQKRMRAQISKDNLERLKADPYLLDKLVCGDESPFI